jgi:hypothetical protein
MRLSESLFSTATYRLSSFIVDEPLLSVSGAIWITADRNYLSAVFYAGPLALELPKPSIFV